MVILTRVNSKLRKEVIEAFMKMSDAVTLDNIIKNALAYHSYQYEPWHYHYVGINKAKQRHNENLT